MAATTYLAAKFFLQPVGRLIRVQIRLREERMQTQGLPPPNPRPEDEDRCAGVEDLLGEEPALSLAEPQVSPPTSPTSWARHAPCGRFGIDDFPASIAVFGGHDEVFFM